MPKPGSGASGEAVTASSEQPAPLSKAAAALSDAVARLTGGDSAAEHDTHAGPAKSVEHDARAGQDKSSAAAALSGVVSGLAAGARAGGRGAVVGGSFLAELLAATATRLPLRDKAILQAQHPGLDTEQLADDVVGAACRVTGAIGGAAGGLAAAQWLATPSLIAVPVELAAETLLVAAVELKLVAELHEIYDARPKGDRTAAYLEAWTTQRGFSGEGQTPGLASGLTAVGAAALRKRITGRLARNLGSFLPFLAGAVVGARNNASATRKLGQRLRADLAVRPQVIPSQRLPPH